MPVFLLRGAEVGKTDAFFFFFSKKLSGLALVKMFKLT